MRKILSSTPEARTGQVIPSFYTKDSFVQKRGPAKLSQQATLLDGVVGDLLVDVSWLVELCGNVVELGGILATVHLSVGQHLLPLFSPHFVQVEVLRQVRVEAEVGGWLQQIVEHRVHR